MPAPAAALAVAASLLLGGCAAAPLPAGLTAAEAHKIVDDNNRRWWTSMFPTEPMPVVEPIRTVSVGESGVAVNECVQAAGLVGVTEDKNGGFSVSSTTMTAQNALHRQLFVCSLEYPNDLSHPEQSGYLSRAQLDYLWDYYTQRLVPCLELLGYDVPAHQGRETFLSGGASRWLPYFDLSPEPAAAEQWQAIDYHCPPAPYVADWRPSVHGSP
ncbi:hypothetical protein BH11ACT4_BH11ACT4_13870 [soil metagenome]